MHTSHTALWVTFRLVLEKKAHFEGSTSTSGLTSTVLHPHYLPPGPFPTQPRPAELSGELCCKIAPSNAPLHRPKLPVSLPWPDSPARYGQVLRAGASKTRPPMPTASLRAIRYSQPATRGSEVRDSRILSVARSRSRIDAREGAERPTGNPEQKAAAVGACGALADCLDQLDVGQTGF